MDHSRISAEQIIDRYLVGRLSPEDEELFEEHLFECVECLGNVQAGEQMRRGLRDVASADAGRAEVAQGLAAIGFIAWLRSRRPGTIAGITSFLLAVALLPLTVFRQQTEIRRLRGAPQHSMDPGLSEPTANLQIVPLGIVRGEAADAVTIRPKTDGGVVLLSLELQTVGATAYQATIYDSSGLTLWVGTNLEPNLYDSLMIALPSNFLRPGEHRIVINGLPGDELGDVPGDEPDAHEAEVEETTFLVLSKK